MLILGIAVSGQQPVLNQVLLVAADINNGVLQQVGARPDTGQGLPVSNLSNRVTIYYSKHDDVLLYSQIFFRAYHNPSYPDRLGLGGPYSYNADALPANTWGIDCAAVISDTVIKNVPQLPPGTSSHSAYFYIPQVLTDWVATLTGTAAADVANRVLNPAAEDQQAFIMRSCSRQLPDLCVKEPGPQQVRKWGRERLGNWRLQGLAQTCGVIR
jgi:hypothetical protein